MMTCKEVLDSLSEYLDEDLKADVVDAMHQHIGVCTECRAEFDTLTMTIKLYRHYETPEMPAPCHDRLVKILELEKMKKKSGQSTSGSEG